MIVVTDSLDYAHKILGDDINWGAPAPDINSSNLSQLVQKLYPGREAHSTEIECEGIWRYLLIVEKAPVSQYDIVIDLCQQNVELPHGTLCLAGSGEKFHGLRNRGWAALPGNLHLTVHLRPDLMMAQTGIGFTILSAVSVVDAIDRIPGLNGRAMIKWVNDIFIDDGKLSGFLTHTTSIDGMVTSAVIGIGLNVEATPEIEPDKFISKAVSLNDLVENGSICSQKTAFEYLIDTLDENYRKLSGGEMPFLLEKYRNRSLILGREVEIVPDSPHNSDEEAIRGRVVEIGQNLELFLEGHKFPITHGRLAFIT